MAELDARLGQLATLLTPNSHPNIGALWAIAKDIEAIKLNLKFYGYDLALQLAGALPPISGLEVPLPIELTSKAATQADIESDWARPWFSALKITPLYHRKLWEYVYTLQALWQNGMLEPGRRGLGFGCGREPLPSCFAARGVHVTATDLSNLEQETAGWAQTQQHADSPEALYFPHLIDRQTFEQRVVLRDADMRTISADLRDYDFCWSICALEHLGSIAAGMDFVANSLDTLRPGGMAVHTTEFNFLYDDRTIDNWPTVLPQRRHFLELAERLRQAGHEVAPLDFDTGSGRIDHFVDVPPFEHDWSSAYQTALQRAPAHLKLTLDGFPSTCFGLIIKKGGDGG